MDASDQAAALANAFSDGINCIAYIRTLHADPPAVSAEELLELRKALDDFQDSLKTFQGGVPGYVVETSLKVSSDLVHCIENVRAHLSTITPGAQLPTSFFDLIDVAWAEIFKTMHAS